MFDSRNVYIAPGDRHMLLEKEENNLVLRLDDSVLSQG